MKIDKLNFKIFDEIHFKNGYSKECPFMRVECLCITYGRFEGKLCYAISLGKILELNERSAKDWKMSYTCKCGLIILSWSQDEKSYFKCPICGSVANIEYKHSKRG